MTEEQVKEQISLNFVRMIASREGLKCSSPDPDSGVDLALCRAVPMPREGGVRFLDDGKYLELQLKATSEARIEFSGQEVRYDLEVKTFNDLIARRDSDSPTPLLLVLVILPDDPDAWLSVDADQLIVRRVAFWYSPPPEKGLSSNKSSVRISIPIQNALSLGSLEALRKVRYA